MSAPAVRENAVAAALKACSLHFAFATSYNLVANILVLAFPIYMLNTYNRVLASRSLATLAVLFVGLAIAILFKSVFAWLRSAVLVRAAIRIDRRPAERVPHALFERRVSGRADIGPQALRDLDQFRQYVTGTGGGAAIDAPLGGLFLAALAILNFPMALTAAAAILVITGLTVADMIITRGDMAKADTETLGSYNFVEQNLPKAEAVVGMGFTAAVLAKWARLREPALAAQMKAGYRGHAFDETIAAVRYLAQGAVIAVGVIEIMAGTANPGVMIAGLFIFNFAMGPFTRIVNAWSSYPSVRQGLKRLNRVLAEAPARPAVRTTLPAARGELTVKGVYFIPPGEERAVLRNISFGLRPGTSLGVIGLIGSGKTTLARLLVGAAKPTAGVVRLDGNDIFDWTRSDGGRYVGYVPQSVAILSATVAENIGRFGLFDSAEIVAAAELAGVHAIIQKLPLGYDTPIGDGGHPLSGGQRQLVALARAVVGRPALVVLDEPNASLDGPGEDALVQCVGRLKEAGSTVVLISHRPQLVRSLDRLLLIKDGEMVAFGENEDVWKELGRPVAVKRGAALAALAERTALSEAPSHA